MNKQVKQPVAGRENDILLKAVGSTGNDGNGLNANINGGASQCTFISMVMQYNAWIKQASHYHLLEHRHIGANEKCIQLPKIGCLHINEIIQGADNAIHQAVGVHLTDVAALTPRHNLIQVNAIESQKLAAERAKSERLAALLAEHGIAVPEDEASF